MGRGRIDGWLPGLALAAALLAMPLPAAPLDPEFGDQVADPGEAERADLVLEERVDPSFATPEAVAGYVQEQLGVPYEWSEAAPNLVVVRNAGSGYRPDPAEAAYDDLFLVVTRTAVHTFTHGNAEGTEHRTYVKKYGYDRYVDPVLQKAVTPALAPGSYRFLVGKHQDSYKALRVHSLDYARDPLPSQRMNGRRGAPVVGAVNVHKGGSTWNWSVGCLTVHYARYQAFIDLFPMGSWGRFYLLGDWDGADPRRAVLADARTRTRTGLFAALWAPWDVR